MAERPIRNRGKEEVSPEAKPKPRPKPKSQAPPSAGGIDILTPSINLMVASCGLGKSHLVHYLTYCLFASRKVDYCVCFTMTPDDYDYLPSDLVHASFDEEVLGNVLRLQEKSKAAGNPKNVLIIFDDCIGSINFASKQFTQLATRFRHFNATIVFTTQYANKLPSVIRECTINAFLFEPGTELSCRSLFEIFGHRKTRSLREWEDYLVASTGDHAFVWVNNRCASKNPADRYKVMRAPAEIPRMKWK